MPSFKSTSPGSATISPSLNPPVTSIRRVRNPHVNFPFFQPCLSHAQRVAQHHEHEPAPILRFHRAAPHRQNTDAFPRIDSHVHVNIWQQLQLVLVHFAQQLANPARLPPHFFLPTHLPLPH